MIAAALIAVALVAALGILWWRADRVSAPGGRPDPHSGDASRTGTVPAVERFPGLESVDAAEFPEPVPPRTNLGDLSQLPSVAAVELHFRPPDRAKLEPDVPELTLLAIHVDGLDDVQRALGDVARARALLEVAHAVRGTLRSKDTCARWEKDRLLALLPGIDRSVARKVVARVQGAVSSLTLVTHNGQEVQLGVMVGSASSPDEGCTLPELMGTVRRDLERVRARLAPRTGRETPAERIRQAVPLVSN